MKPTILLLALTVFSTHALAATRTVTLSVPGMDCAACPITVKKALTRVSGVRATVVSFEQRQARVTFDDERTSVKSLMRATRDAGYPSTEAGDGE